MTVIRKAIFIVVCALLSCAVYNVQAQTIDAISLGYWGEMGVNPGASANVFITLRETTRTKRRKGKTISRQMSLAPSVHYYSLPYNHSGLGLGTELQWERNKKKTWYRFAKFGAFYHTRFNTGTTYYVAPDVDPVPAGTRGYALGGFGAGFGRYLPVIPIDFSLGINAYFIAPYNSIGFAPMPSLEFKIRYSL